MPYEKNGWTISAGYRTGEIKGPRGETIYFGSYHHLAKTANRVDLRDMSHGSDDTEDKCIPCFIAAADIMHSELQSGNAATVHCRNGNSRTAFALIAYFARHQGFTIKDAGAFITEGQKERTDGLVFSLEKQANNNSYWRWINNPKWSPILTDPTKGKEYRAAHSISGPERTKHKIFHAVMTNISRELPSAPTAADSGSSSKTNSDIFSHGKRIRESEVRILLENAAVYKKYKY
ncbi:dual specificity protein phosphatase family protein [Pseudomonas sp. TUM22785]|uniref:dual specificity protein phosphatase family protein n=1 Tax=Pseudomonas sp. TUM22785 TaxID=3019098 RepID=UPI0023064F65|nr:dual specificity protein phosphatase family protein [Pseudomonas sp. TUM22785]WCD82967.1 dual specificity protein phosphatase family protein [Pseudomonas sp. TUM22785]